MDSSVRAMKRVRMDSKLSTFSATAWVRCASVAMGRQGSLQGKPQNLDVATLDSSVRRGATGSLSAGHRNLRDRAAVSTRMTKQNCSGASEARRLARFHLSPGRRDSRWRPRPNMEGGSQSGWGVASSAASTWCRLSRRGSQRSFVDSGGRLYGGPRHISSQEPLDGEHLSAIRLRWPGLSTHLPAGPPALSPRRRSPASPASGSSVLHLRASTTVCNSPSSTAPLPLPTPCCCASQAALASRSPGPSCANALRVNNARLGVALQTLQQRGLAVRSPNGWHLPA